VAGGGACGFPAPALPVSASQTISSSAQFLWDNVSI